MDTLRSVRMTIRCNRARRKRRAVEVERDRITLVAKAEVKAKVTDALRAHADPTRIQRKELRRNVPRAEIRTHRCAAMRAAAAATRPVKVRATDKVMCMVRARIPITRDLSMARLLVADTQRRDLSVADSARVR